MLESLEQKSLYKWEESDTSKIILELSIQVEALCQILQSGLGTASPIRACGKVASVVQSINLFKTLESHYTSRNLLSKYELSYLESQRIKQLTEYTATVNIVAVEEPICL